MLQGHLSPANDYYSPQKFIITLKCIFHIIYFQMGPKHGLDYFLHLELLPGTCYLIFISHHFSFLTFCRQPSDKPLISSLRLNDLHYPKQGNNTFKGHISVELIFELFLSPQNGNYKLF